MMRGISIEKPANHALVLGFVFTRLILKKLDTSLGQGDSDFHTFIPED